MILPEQFQSNALKEAQGDKRLVEATTVKGQQLTHISSGGFYISDDTQAEKTVKELGDKADAAKVKEVNDAIAPLKESLKGDDTAKIKADAEALTKPLHELTEKLYQQAQQAQAQQQAGAQQGPQQGPQAGAKKADDDVAHET